MLENHPPPWHCSCGCINIQTLLRWKQCKMAEATSFPALFHLMLPDGCGALRSSNRRSNRLMPTIQFKQMSGSHQQERTSCTEGTRELRH